MSSDSDQLPHWAEYGVLPAMNVVLALVISGLIFVIIGENPLDAMSQIIFGALGTAEGFAFTLYYATSFVFTGLAVAIAAHGGLFNIGGEGQAYLGGLGVAIICLAMGDVAPWWVVAPAALASAFLFGALWAFVPAVLQVTRGSHVVITTILFNFIAASLMVYLLTYVLKEPGTLASQTREFGPGARLPSLNALFAFFGLDSGAAPLNLSTLFAGISILLVWALIWRTRFGYRLRTLGANPSAAAYAGMPNGKIVIITMLVSGGFAGMMALNTVMGDQARLQTDFTAGAGFVGIAVALMGRSHPFGILLTATLFGVLYQGGAELAFWSNSITREMIVLVQALIIFFVGAMENMFKPVLSMLLWKVDAAVSREGN